MDTPLNQLKGPDTQPDLLDKLLSDFTKSYSDALEILRDPEDLRYLYVLIRNNKSLKEMYAAGLKKTTRGLWLADELSLAAFLLGWIGEGQIGEGKRI